ncbi:MAG: methyltransferase [Candidatus Methylomirabilota bacterium]
MRTEVASAPQAGSPRAILEMATAFQRSRILLTAHELDLFTVLDDEPKSSADVAKTLGTDRRGTDRLMNALCSMALLEKRDGRFSATPSASRFLVRGRPEFLAGLMHTVHLWETWSTLTDAVRQGGSVVSGAIEDRGEKWLRAFIAAMHWRGRQHAQEVMALLDLSGVSRVLDVGGGSGVYAMAFARAKPDITAVVFDLPSVVPMTQEYIAQEELADRVKTVAGDYEVHELGTGFDLVFLSAIIHGNSERGNRGLVRKCAGTLKPKGQLVVQDFIIDEDRMGPPFAVLFALNMLVGTESGDTYTESDVREWMQEAGLSGITRKDTEFGTSLLTGRK